MKKLMISLLALAMTAAAGAVPAKRTPFSVRMADGTEVMAHRMGDERSHYLLDANQNLLMQNAAGAFTFATISPAGELVESLTPVRLTAELMQRRQAPAMRRAAQVGTFPGTAFPSKGKQKALVILVEFKDTKFKLGSNAAGYFTDMLNKSGFNQYGGTGCARDYFLEQSSGAFDCDFDVYGPVTLANNYKYYGQNYQGFDKAPWEMVIEACQQLDDTVDFSQYDRDGDGEIDNVFVFYAGEGEATSNNSNLVWPHSYYVVAEGYNLKFDGKLLNSYGCSNEWLPAYDGMAARPDGVGTFVHEFSHILGLPDLYITDESELTSKDQGYFTPGEWSVLDYGPYNNDGCTPPSYSAFERNALGWIELDELAADATEGHLTDLQKSNHAYSITNPKNDNEFFLLECRVRTGWDAYLPADGMLCWHVDYNSSRWTNNSVNNKSAHQYVDLVEADGVTEKTYRSGGDCYPGTSRVTSLAPRWWTNGATGYSLKDITLTANKEITFSLGSTGGNGGSSSSTTVPDGCMSVANVIDSALDGSTASVVGYIVGYVKNSPYNANQVKFTADGCSQKTNIVLADTPDETNIDLCIPVALKSGGDARTYLNLSDNPAMLGQRVKLTGTLDAYFLVPGLKNVSNYELVADNEENSNTNLIIAPEVEMEQPLFDLQGRRVASPLKGHLYVRAGKVIRF